MSKTSEAPVHPDLNAIAAFIDGRLDRDDRSGLVDHLAECRECRLTLEMFSRAQGATAAHESTSARADRLPVRWLSLAATAAIVTTAGLLLSRTGSQPESVSPAAPPTAIEAPLPTTPPAPAPTPVPPIDVPRGPAQQVSPRATEDLTTRRSAVRRIGDKTFRLEAGEWIDSAYDPLAVLPVETIGPADRAAVLGRVPELKRYLALGPRVLVVHGGVVYRFSPS